MKTVVITGVNKGLGKEIMGQLVQRGHFVYGIVRNSDYYNEHSQHQPANSRLVLADVTDDNCASLLLSVIGDRPVDLLINNAGIGGEGMSLDTATAREIMALLDVHCLGAMRVTQALKQNLLQATQPVVLNLSSRFGSIGYQYNQVFKEFEISYAYRIAKAAQNMLTNCLRVELGDRIEFVSLTPGRLITTLAQKDANLSPQEGASRIIEYWEAGLFTAQNGILQVPDSITPW